MKRRPCLSTIASTVLGILAGSGWGRIRFLRACCAGLSDDIVSGGTPGLVRPRRLDEDHAPPRARQRRAYGILPPPHRVRDLLRRHGGTEPHARGDELRGGA